MALFLMRILCVFNHASPGPARCPCGCSIHVYVRGGRRWPAGSQSKEPNIIRGGTPYLSHCDATYVAPPAGGNAVDVLSVDHSISYVVEE